MHSVTVTRLMTRRVEKPWGRRDLLPVFGPIDAEAGPVGEIWFEDPRGRDQPLLVKYLFTSEKLSIQVHPDDDLAWAQGVGYGKDEAWLVLEAEPDAVMGIGLSRAVDKEELRAAALDGSIEQLVDWRPARAGDTYYSPGGTIHSLGPGLKLIEVQQNADLTYRLYDFGRPRELHLDEALTAATPGPYRAPFEPYADGAGSEVLAEGLKFVLERWRGARSGRLAADAWLPVWLVPLAGDAIINGETMEAGTAWLAEGSTTLSMGDDCDLLVAYPGMERHPLFEPDAG